MGRKPKADTRKSGPGLYLLNLKRFTSIRVTTQVGESLNWARLADTQAGQALEVKAKVKPAAAPPKPSADSVPAKP